MALEGMEFGNEVRWEQLSPRSRQARRSFNVFFDVQADAHSLKGPSYDAGLQRKRVTHFLLFFNELGGERALEFNVITPLHSLPLPGVSKL